MLIQTFSVDVIALHPLYILLKCTWNAWYSPVLDGMGIPADIRPAPGYSVPVSSSLYMASGSSPSKVTYNDSGLPWVSRATVFNSASPLSSLTKSHAAASLSSKGFVSR